MRTAATLELQLFLASALLGLTAVGCDADSSGANGSMKPIGGKADEVLVCDVECTEDEECVPGSCRSSCSIDDEGCCEPNECVPACEGPEDCPVGWLCTEENFCDVDRDPVACDDENPCAEGLACVLEPCGSGCSIDDEGCCPDRSICLIECSETTCPQLFECQSDGEVSVCIDVG